MKNKLIYLLALAIITLASCSKSNNKKSIEEQVFSSNWQFISQDSIQSEEKAISTINFKEQWETANIPTTVLNALQQNGHYQDAYVGTNLENINAHLFKSSWWFRHEFNINNKNQHHTLKIDGINQYADVWVNGQLVADSSEITNPFRQYSLELDQYLVNGKNAIAFKIYPPKKGDYNIGFVDWNPMAPDQEMGIIRPVRLITTNAISLDKPYVQTLFTDNNYKSVDLAISTVVKNHTENAVEAMLKVEVESIIIEKKVSLKPREEKTISFLSSEFSKLKLNNPKLWWPHTLGEPSLYSAKIEAYVNNEISDTKSLDFGIREVSEYFTKEGHRGYKINGEKILIRGGGWVDNLTLNNSDANIKAQLEYVKSMNFNTIRLEGFWGTSQTMYDLCDQMGILIMVGWSCHWEWDDYIGKTCHEDYGAPVTDKDINLIANAWEDQIIWLRNHPSIFTWIGGSDKIPAPGLEKRYFETFERYDSSRAYLASAKEWKSLAGKTAVKMRGPYDIVPPIYWYQDTLNGGAFGFNTETGPGAQVPPLESIKKMIPEEHLWPIDEVWEYHCGRNEFNDLKRYNKALFARYGEMHSVEEYAFKAQAHNYELMRAMFEAFSVNKGKATGVIQWMLNSAWPEMYWQLYDYYLMPNGAFYGAKTGSNLIHSIYHYTENSIYLVNERLEDNNDLKVEFKVFNINSELVFNKEIDTNALASSSQKLLNLPPLNLKGTYFLSLITRNNSNQAIDNNFYWLSTQQDILDYSNSDWFYTPFKKYADFSDLNTMPPANVNYEYSSKKVNDSYLVTIELKNNSDKIAFFLNAKVIDKNTGDEIMPAIWSDNYISLLPQESRILTAKIDSEYMDGKKIDFALQMWNSK